MQWSANALIIGTKKHGESSLIIEAMVEGKGRHLGLVRSGRTKRLSPTLQPGNNVELTWNARLENHLGTYKIELQKARAANMLADQKKLYLAQLLFAHLRLLPERDPHDELLAKTIFLFDECNDNLLLAKELAHFEIRLLEELGFGLDIYSCALSGENKGLTHISPKSGRAVKGELAKKYIEKLLPLPQFLINKSALVNGEQIEQAFRLSGFFLHKHIWQIRQINEPPTRQILIKLLLDDINA